MSNDDSYHWTHIRAAYQKIGINEFGSVLLERILELPDICPDEAVTKVVDDWFFELATELEKRIRAGSGEQGNSASATEKLEAEVMSLLIESEPLGKKLNAAKASLARASSGGGSATAMSILANLLKQHAVDIRRRLEPTHKQRNWNAIDREIKKIQKQWGTEALAAGPIDRLRLERRTRDCAQLIAEVHKRLHDPGSSFRLDDVKTVEAIHGYFQEFWPQCWGDYQDLQFKPSSNPPVEFMDVMKTCLEEVDLSDRQRAAVDTVLEGLDRRFTGNDQKNHHRALLKACERLRGCFARYIDDSLF